MPRAREFVLATGWSTRDGVGELSEETWERFKVGLKADAHGEATLEKYDQLKEMDAPRFELQMFYNNIQPDGWKPAKTMKKLMHRHRKALFGEKGKNFPTWVNNAVMMRTVFEDNGVTIHASVQALHRLWLAYKQLDHDYEAVKHILDRAEELGREADGYMSKAIVEAAIKEIQPQYVQSDNDAEQQQPGYNFNLQQQQQQPQPPVPDLAAAASEQQDVAQPVQQDQQQPVDAGATPSSTSHSNKERIWALVDLTKDADIETPVRMLVDSLRKDSLPKVKKALEATFETDEHSETADPGTSSSTQTVLGKRSADLEAEAAMAMYKKAKKLLKEQIVGVRV